MICANPNCKKQFERKLKDNKKFSLFSLCCSHNCYQVLIGQKCLEKLRHNILNPVYWL